MIVTVAPFVPPIGYGTRLGQLLEAAYRLAAADWMLETEQDTVVPIHYRPQQPAAACR
jgi:hypothetical protein